MYHLYTILVKPKYDISFVKAIDTSFRNNISQPFVHTCLTDNIDQFKNDTFCDLIDISNHDLPTFWNKMLFFKENEICKDGEKCIFFDLDSMILKDLTPMINHIDNFLLIGQNLTKIHDTYITKAVNNPKHGRHLTIINSSCMMWIGGQHQKLWEIFNKNKEDNMLYYYGNDEFITFEYAKNYRIIDKKWIFGFETESTAVYSNKIR